MGPATIKAVRGGAVAGMEGSKQPPEQKRKDFTEEGPLDEVLKTNRSFLCMAPAARLSVWEASTCHLLVV